MITAFDADVLIYAGVDGHSLGQPVAQLLATSADYEKIGSVLLLIEILAKPMRLDPESSQVVVLMSLVGCLKLLPLDVRTATMSLSLAAKYGLKTVDAAHLATAIVAGADRFLTNNRKDFRKDFQEIDVVYPEDL